MVQSDGVVEVGKAEETSTVIAFRMDNEMCKRMDEARAKHTSLGIVLGRGVFAKQALNFYLAYLGYPSHTIHVGSRRKGVKSKKKGR